MQEGPLGGHLSALADRLLAYGYARPSIRRKLQLLADFSRWLQRKGVEARELTPGHGRAFLLSRRRAGFRPHHGDRAAVAQVLELLRQQGITAEPIPHPITTPIERLLEEYDFYLQKERSLAAATQTCYRPFVRQFLFKRFGDGRIDLAVLRASDVLTFVQCAAGQLKGKRAQLMTAALRSFLRFARFRGDIELDLAACVPSVAGWSLSTVPKSLPPDKVEKVLAHCERRSATGKRDNAILLLLARLGLRAGEVARLKLDDLDWERGCITVHGKMGRVDELPLPAAVGTALVAYLKEGRPPGSNTRLLFLRSDAPLCGFAGQKAVGAVVKRALEKAGIVSPRKGAHQFRHTLASELLRHGGSLTEIGQILRHRSPETTAIYAKVDLPSLRLLAVPWPGGNR
jgi:site-specific recombinase XerD